MTFAEYWGTALQLYTAQVHNQRFGQIAFNLLRYERSDIAAKVLYTDLDPFEWDIPKAETIDQWADFIEFVETEWSRPS